MSGDREDVPAMVPASPSDAKQGTGVGRVFCHPGRCPEQRAGHSCGVESTYESTLPQKPHLVSLPETELNRPSSLVGVLRAYNPVSWFHPKGIHRVLAGLKPLLPDVGGSLFLTFTVNPALFESPRSAFQHARSRLRRVFFELRKGVEWEGKRYVIDAPYCVKVEFHRNGWAHFHVIFRTRRYVPGELLTALWKLGRTDVRRISDAKFRYLLKYVTKGGELPDWVLDFKWLRVWQSVQTHSFGGGLRSIVPPRLERVPG